MPFRLSSAMSAALVGGAVFALAGAASAQGWTKIANPPAVIGLDGQSHQASCSGFPGTDPRFSFFARRTASKNLVVYFEGGGACWDNLTCSFPIAGLPPQVPQFFVPMVPPGIEQSLVNGIFDAANPANPVRDWNLVYIPYCTGDIHTGSATKTYTSVGNPALGLPAGSPVQIEHRGFDNFMVVLDWMKKNINAPKNVLVTGVSAGGYGATANSPWVGRAYPNAHLYLLADASQGVTTQAFDTGNPGRNSWNPQLAPWVFGSGADVPSGPELMRRAALGQPKAKTAQFTTKLDNTQIEFYGVMTQFYGPGGSCPNPAVDWSQQMTGQLVADAADVGNYRYYLAGGSYHTLLRDNHYYTESSAGPAFASWLGDMLANRGGTNGQGGQWFNVACPTCLVDLPCQ